MVIKINSEQHNFASGREVLKYAGVYIEED